MANEQTRLTQQKRLLRGVVRPEQSDGTVHATIGASAPPASGLASAAFVLLPELQATKTMASTATATPVPDMATLMLA